ncbi:hypothetical protein B7494_g4499 [Chlorociboria aeruginascens]|nr:hypothetical protein B7494_g4499 [Chlorociboria aeruginascens]
MSSDKPLPFIYQFAAGAVAGVSEILVMYPLDVVKTRVFSRLYRGIEAPILMEAPKRATKFAANDAWGKFYRDLFGVAKMNQSLSVLTGASAGATEAFVVVPFELIKIRLQDRASAGKYTGMIDCVVKTVRTEGPLALYNGLESTMWRHILWNAGYFGCIFQVRALLPKADNKTTQMGYDMLSGATGGTVGTILNTPMDVVKSRIQNSPKIAGSIPKYNWAWPATVTVFREEGFSALYKGFLPKVLRLGPGGGFKNIGSRGIAIAFLPMSEFYRSSKGGCNTNIHKTTKQSQIKTRIVITSKTHYLTPKQSDSALSFVLIMEARWPQNNFLTTKPLNGRLQYAVPTMSTQTDKMAREGTRSATGNSKPRIFPTVTETPATTTKKRATANSGVKRGPKKATTVKASKPTGVTKKKAPAKKTNVATKAKGVVKKVEGDVTGNPEKKAAGTKKVKGTNGTKAKAPATKKK